MRPSPADAWRTSVADESGVGRARWPGPPRRAKLAASVVLDLSEGDKEETATTRSSYESTYINGPLVPSLFYLRLKLAARRLGSAQALAGWSAASLASASKDN
mgnify:CR=1 FL=1